MVESGSPYIEDGNTRNIIQALQTYGAMDLLSKLSFKYFYDPCSLHIKPAHPKAQQARTSLAESQSSRINCEDLPILGFCGGLSGASWI